jgi:DNA repair protein RadC
MVLVDIRLLMSNALLSNSTRIAVAHNHPSGNLIPSQADKQLTSKIANACRLLDIQIVDHIILTDIAYYSFKDSGDL